MLSIVVEFNHSQGEARMKALVVERAEAWKAAMFADDDSPEYIRYLEAKAAIEELALDLIRLEA